MEKRRNTYWFLILGLLILSGAMEAVMTCCYESLTRQPLAFGSLFQIRPVYNESGSWIHARSGLGYRNGVLLAEHSVALIVAAYLYRALEAWGYLFRVSRRWLYALDCGVAATLYRVITRFRGTFTLDYVKVGRFTYDIPDLCIGICIVGMIGWFISYTIHYYPYKKRKEKGMKWKERFLWELRLNKQMAVVPFYPRDRWQELLLDPFL